MSIFGSFGKIKHLSCYKGCEKGFFCFCFCLFVCLFFSAGSF